MLSINGIHHVNLILIVEINLEVFVLKTLFQHLLVHTDVLDRVQTLIVLMETIAFRGLIEKIMTQVCLYATYLNPNPPSSSLPRAC